LNAEIVHRLEQSLDVPEQAAALASEVRSAAKSAFREWLEVLRPRGPSRSSRSIRELLESEFAERRIGSVSTAEDDGEKK
jgi:histidine ammonia-lyase